MTVDEKLDLILTQLTALLTNVNLILARGNPSAGLSAILKSTQSLEAAVKNDVTLEASVSELGLDGTVKSNSQAAMITSNDLTANIKDC